MGFAKGHLSNPAWEGQGLGDALNCFETPRTPIQNMLPGLKSKFEIACVLSLVLSGVAHGLLFLILSQAWEDPLSFRKATLFGISTGVTLWSCLWVISNIPPSFYDPLVRNCLCGSLWIEVALISLQTWRGQLSHFNREGWINGSIELSMLILISAAVVPILWITWRVCLSDPFQRIAPSTLWAMRWGMVLLSLSAIVGYAITWVGQQQVAQGISPNLWKSRGVLKFPHGAALHAIQLLAVASWLAQRIRFAGGVWMIHGLALSHLSWLAYAAFQTFAGLERFELRPMSLVLITATLLSSLVAIAPLLSQALGKLRKPTI